MSRINYFLLSIPTIYAAFALYKGSNISDSLVVASFCALIGVFMYISTRYQTQESNGELSKLEEALKIERLKYSIESTKEGALLEKARRDARKASFGYDESKEIKF